MKYSQTPRSLCTEIYRKKERKKERLKEIQSLDKTDTQTHAPCAISVHAVV